MAYYSGTASSLADLRTALLTHAQTDGWVLTGDVLSKAGVYFQIQANATNITCLGCESNLVANPAPGVVQIGRIYFLAGQTTREISFPCNYEIFGFAQELYLVVNYDVDSYQWIAFGKTTVPGVPGQGGWCGASIGSAIPSGSYSGSYAPIGYWRTAISTVSMTLSSLTTGQLFGTNENASLYPSYKNCWVNHNIDGLGWDYGANYPVGTLPMMELEWMQPTGWNSEATLLPIRHWNRRPSFKISLSADLEHSRRIRIDNLEPGDVLTLGSDKWKIFPWYRKDILERNGGGAENHSGTFGWAIRYQGP